MTKRQIICQSTNYLSFYKREERRLCWYGHVERFNSAVKTAFDIQVNGKRGPGRPKMTWKQLTERDRRERKLSAIDPHDRDTWRSGVRSAMPVALKGAHCCGYGPYTCTLIKNPMMMMMITNLTICRFLNFLDLILLYKMMRTAPKRVYDLSSGFLPSQDSHLIK